MISVFCTVGGHTVNFDAVPPMELPDGWEAVAASVIHAPKSADDPWEPGIWYADVNSNNTVLVCPQHQARLVRLNNK